MGRKTVNIVWFKRDLRLSDHVPMSRAIKAGRPIVLVYLFEPEYIENGDTSRRHLSFVKESLDEIDEKLAILGTRILRFKSTALDAFKCLLAERRIESIFSYRETGVAWTYERDKRMSHFFLANGIKWREFDFAGVRRGLRNREGWTKGWNEYIQSETENPDLSNLKVDNEVFVPDNLLELGPSNTDSRFQKGGTEAGKSVLDDFVERDGSHFIASLAKPVESRNYCSRISPYLAWGNLSNRQVVRVVTKHGLNRDFRAFKSRVAWRDHFIQRFEMAESIEFEPINHFASELERFENDEFREKWEKGMTGFPLVDAAMRCVNETGWLNFRLRATVVSFLTHILWMDWRKSAKYLAKQFLDYEPGIHYSQFMMQSAESGFHTIRVYNPIKQSIENDPNAKFIKEWVPELKELPTEFVHEPWKIPPFEAMALGFDYGKDYPVRMVDYKKAYKHATKTLWGWKERDDVKKEARRLIRRLKSR